MKYRSLITAATLVSQLGLAGVAHGAVVEVTGESVNANPAVCANVASDGNCSATTQQNVSGGSNSVNVNPAICANVASSGNCVATATQTVAGGGSTGVVTPVTILPDSPLDTDLLASELVSVTGNTLNVNPAICANVLSSGDCVASAIQTVSGGVIAPVLGLGGGSLPKAGSAGWSLLLSLLGAAGSAVYASRRRLAIGN